MKLYKNDKIFKSINNNPINNNSIINPFNNKPVEVNKPVEINKPVEVNKPVEIDKPIEVNKPIEIDKPVEEINNDWDFIDKVIYINLKHRTDRDKQILDELKVIPSHKIIRFDAIKEKDGHIGCSKSHIGCLELAIQNNWINVLIIEDDMIWNNYENNIKLLQKLLNNNWDVISLGNYNVKYDKNTYRLFNGLCSHAYVVNNHYFQKLKENFEFGLLKLIEAINYTKSDKLNNYKKYCLDRYWEILMKNDNWYITIPVLSIQRPSYSDTCYSFRVHKQ
jgi:glycosyl transferase family 25